MRPISAILAAILTATPALAQIEYEVIILPRPDGFNVVNTWDLNNQGEIIGDMTLLNPPPDQVNRFPFRWDPDLGLRMLDLPDGFVGGTANALNNNGDAIGKVYDQDFGIGNASIVLWTGGVPEIRGVASVFGTHTHQFAINDAGQYTYYNDRSSFFFNGVTDVAIPPLDGTVTKGFGLTAAGQVVGISSVDGPTRAVEWNEIDGLSRIDGRTGDTSFLFVATEMNESGGVVGRGYNDNDDMFIDHAFVLEPDGTLLDIDAINADQSFAWDINESGVVVGNYKNPFELLAFVYDQDNGTRVLNDLVDPALGLDILRAQAVNDRGQILASGIVSGDFGRRGFLLTPVPAPSTFLIVLVGIGIGRTRERLPSFQVPYK